MTTAQHHFETLQLHAGQEQPDPATDARAVPIYATTSYVFRDFDQAAARFALADAGNIYGRLTNTTQEVLEQRVAALEGGTAALAVASGAAAVEYALRNITQSGDHIVASRTIYGGTYNLLRHTLPRDGIATTFVDIADHAALEAAITDRTRLVYFETFGNPNADLPDFEAIAAIAHRHGLPVIVDNTFATLGGVIVEGGRFDWAAGAGGFPTLSEPDPSYHGLRFFEALGPTAFVTRVRAVLLRDTGATISPFAAFLLLQGIETLSLRVERHVANALRVIEYLRTVPEVASISHPSIEGREDHERYLRYFPNGACPIFTFDIRGGMDAARAFIDGLSLFSLLANVADAKSLVIHPASTTHSQESEEELAAQGIGPGTIRLSIGLEHIDDILADLERGVAAVRDLR